MIKNSVCASSQGIVIPLSNNISQKNFVPIIPNSRKFIEKCFYPKGSNFLIDYSRELREKNAQNQYF